MSAAFTPGPWLAQENKYSEFVIVRAETDDTILLLDDTEHGDADWPNYAANARLISAAPELYEALDDLVSFLRAHVEHFKTYNPLTEDADKALAKARGDA